MHDTLPAGGNTIKTVVTVLSSPEAMVASPSDRPRVEKQPLAPQPSPADDCEAEEGGLGMRRPKFKRDLRIDTSFNKPKNAPGPEFTALESTTRPTITLKAGSVAPAKQNQHHPHQPQNPYHHHHHHHPAGLPSALTPPSAVSASSPSPSGSTTTGRRALCCLSIPLRALRRASAKQKQQARKGSAVTLK
eukprot:TRINITY_DN10055_c0_g1_i1.p1 TRINITY_DN10055_c0_g1~~TRINITY_DN10055_c0_g1_i1.p1  ORF type:complete len:190 (+),score=27.73 TRINITY_DN10055_c0_g1_i1:119-688(+)